LLREVEAERYRPLTHRRQRLPIGYGLVFAAVVSLALWWGMFKAVGALWSFFGLAS